MSELEQLNFELPSEEPSLGDSIESRSASLGRLLNSSERTAFDSDSSSSTICTLSESGIECRVCGTNDGKTSTSTLGVMLCMMMIIGLAAIKRRNANRKLMGENHPDAKAEPEAGMDAQVGADR